MRKRAIINVKLNLPAPQELVQSLGLDSNGDTQQFHTGNVLNRVKAYMPYLSGSLYKLTVAQTDISKPQIITSAPQAKYLYKGVKMVDAATGKGPAYIKGIGFRYRKDAVLKATRKKLKYTTTKNPKAGPKWDKALVANEKNAIVADLQKYIETRRRK